MLAPLSNAAVLHNRFTAALGVLAILALIAVMSHWVGQGNDPVTSEALLTLLSSFPLPLLWLLSAIGLGWPMRIWFARGSSHPIALQSALGIAAMLFLNAGLGAIGALTSPVVAWAIFALGLALLLFQQTLLREFPLSNLLPDWPAWSCAPAVAVLLIAACSAPGWLWSSEFGGYDALSYHLQLPKEWLANGRITPLDHNVYSFLPGYVEAAFLHLMSMRGNAMTALYDCQMLHALLTIAAAAMTGVFTSRFVGRTLGSLAGALYLATPWNIVVGSLAYNEMAVNLMLAAGLLIIFDGALTPAKRGLLIGLVSAAAIGAKLTSLGFVAASLGVLLLLRSPPRKWFLVLLFAAIAGVLGLLPYLLRNWSHGGNPLFPFATELFGSAHWSAERVNAWHRGHMPDADLAQRFLALWRQLFIYGFGANPKPGEPWLVQWSVLPWLGVIGGGVALMRSRFRAAASMTFIVLLVQIIFWLACTHLQSRFLLPTAVPLCVLSMLGVATLITRDAAPKSPAVSRNVMIALTFALLLLAIQPMRIYHAERNGSPALAIGTVSQQTGEAMSDADRREFANVYPAIAVNWMLPPTSRVLLVGESAPLYFDLDRITWSTVWDRSPMSLIVRDHPDDGEAVRATLREQGFTHVLFNPTMLRIWERDGWSDPALTARRLQEMFESAAEPIFDYPPPSEITIYALPE